jgi:hypothetical protein
MGSVGDGVEQANFTMGDSSSETVFNFVRDGQFYSQRQLLSAALPALTALCLFLFVIVALPFFVC